jgi:hypothetical protein
MLENQHNSNITNALSEAQDEINNEHNAPDMKIILGKMSNDEKLYQDLNEREFQLETKTWLRNILITWLVILFISFGIIVVSIIMVLLSDPNDVDNPIKKYITHILIGSCIFLTSNLVIIITAFGSIILRFKQNNGNITPDIVKQMVEIFKPISEALKPISELVKSIRS